MQSSHIRAVCLCFLACKPSSFWSIFYKTALKHVLSVAILLFLPVTPYVLLLLTWLCGGLFGCLSSFPSEADWLSLWIFVTELSRAGEGFAR